MKRPQKKRGYASKDTNFLMELIIRKSAARLERLHLNAGKTRSCRGWDKKEELRMCIITKFLRQLDLFYT